MKAILKTLLLTSFVVFICLSMLQCEKNDKRDIDDLKVETGCDSILTLDSPSAAGYPLDYPHDPFELDTAFISDDCLHCVVRYSGGCEQHEFTFGLVYYSSLYNHYVLTHNANGDMCEAYITDTVSFDLTPIQEENFSQITINVGTYITELTPCYTITYYY